MDPGHDPYIEEKNPPVRYSNRTQNINFVWADEWPRDLKGIFFTEPDISANYVSGGIDEVGFKKDDVIYFVNHFVPISIDSEVGSAVRSNIGSGEIKDFAYPKVPAYN